MRSARKFSRETTFGASVHFAPFGGLGIAMCQLSLLATMAVKAMRFPSADHSRLDGVSVRCEIWVVAPSASIHRTKICCPLGSPFATYAMRVPSGDHFTSE